MKFVDITSDQLVNALGSTLFHSLWQAALVGLGLWILLRIVPKKNAHLKYWLSITALTAIVFWSGYTLKDQIAPLLTSHQFEDYAALSAWELSPNLVSYEAYQMPKIQGAMQGMMDSIQPYMSTLVVTWVIGMLLFLVRLQGSMMYLSKLRSTKLSAVPREWEWKVKELSIQLGINRSVTIMQSGLAEIPMVIGHLKPIILIPVGLLAGLPAREVEAVIAHELAHVKRYDYLINIVQTVVESVLFFNPIVWWVSQVIRQQREHCCDDLAVQCCGNHMVYAHALTNLGAWSLKPPVLSMGLFKSKGELFKRVKRLVYPQHSSFKERFVPATILVLTLTCFTWYSLKVQAEFKPKSSPLMTEPLLQSYETTLSNVLNATIPTTVYSDTIPEEVEEPLPPMEPLEPYTEAEEREWVEGEIDFEYDMVYEELADFEVPVIPDFDINVVVPDIPVVPDVDVVVNLDQVVDFDHVVEFDHLVELEALPEIMALNEFHLDDTTKEKIREIMESHRETIEQAKAKQAEAMEMARRKLQETLEGGRPDDLTEEEWEEARESIRRAERQLERAMEDSERALERALTERQNYFKIYEEELGREQRDMERSVREYTRRAERIHRERMDRHRDRMEEQKDRMEVHKERMKVHEHRMRDHEKRMEALKTELVKDGLINSMKDDLKISFKKDLIRINGKKLTGKQFDKYRKLLDDRFGIDGEGELHYKHD